MQGCSIRHPDRTIFFSDCRYRVIENSSLFSLHFREVFNHPYISFFHLLVSHTHVATIIYAMIISDKTTLTVTFV